MTLLSIILPTYNVSAYIVRCLKSILDQDPNEKIEVIVVDDESPDDSVDRAVDYLKNFPAKIIHQKNRGLGGARNAGIQEACGQYVWFVDPDDEIAPNSIEKILSCLHGQDVAVFDYVNIDRKGNKCSYSSMRDAVQDVCGADLIKNVMVSQAWRSVYRRDFLIKNGIFFRERFLHEDGEFNMRVFYLAQLTTYEPFVIYFYHTQNEGSIMNSIRLKNQVDLLYEFETAKMLIQKQLSKSVAQKQIIHRYLENALGVLFRNVLKLSAFDRMEFRRLLKMKRRMIISEYVDEEFNLRRKFTVLLQIYFPYRVIYNFIYNKRIW